MWCLCKLKEDFLIQRIVEVIDLYNFNIDYVDIFLIIDSSLVSVFSDLLRLKLICLFIFKQLTSTIFNLLNSFKIFKSFELFIVRYLQYSCVRICAYSGRIKLILSQMACVMVSLTLKRNIATSFLTLYTLTSVCKLSILCRIYFLRCSQGEFVE